MRIKEAEQKAGLRCSLKTAGLTFLFTLLVREEEPTALEPNIFEQIFIIIYFFLIIFPPF
jgi:hypothetical protein